MKGSKAYVKAIEIISNLYQNSAVLNEIKKQDLYGEYFILLKKAAYAGHVEGMYEFGLQYENIGFLGVPNPLYNPVKCVYWFTKACKFNQAEACNNLATFYERGEGCQKDLNKALELYKKSSDLGSSNGKKNYKIMIKDLNEGGKYSQVPKT